MRSSFSIKRSARVLLCLSFLAQALGSTSVAVASPPSAIAWTEMGPSQICYSWILCDAWSGRISALAPHPTDPQTLYAGAASGGVWKTTNDGASWTPLFDDQPSLSIGAVALDPNDPNTVYVGTGETVSGGIYGNGLFSSADGGSTWNKLGGDRFDICHIADVVVDPVSSNTIIVAADPTQGLNDGPTPRCQGGVYRSTDRGATWDRVIDSPGTGDQLVDRNDSGPSDLIATSGPIYAAIGGDGVYQSPDGGASWNRTSSGLPQNDQGRIELAISSLNANVMYAAVADSYKVRNPNDGGLLGIFKTTDGGTNWVQQGSPGRMCDTSCLYHMSIAVDPVDPETIYVGGLLLVKSINGGASYSDVMPTSGSVPHVDHQVLKFDSANRLLDGTDGGIFRTPDGGASFAQLNSDLRTAQIYPGISGSTSTRFLGGTQDNGSIVYQGGSMWRISILGDGGFTAVDPTNSMIVYSSSYEQIFKSTEGGRNPTRVSTFEMDSGFHLGQHSPLIMDPIDPNVLYAGRSRVWRTTDAGATWQPFSPDFVFPGSPQCCVTAIGLGNNDRSTVYVGRGNGDVEVTTDGGGSWDERSNGLPTRAVSDLIVDPLDARKAYVSFTGYETARVFSTADGGTSWTDVSGNLLQTQVNSLALDSTLVPNVLFAATEHGVYYQRGGLGWAELGPSLPNAVVSDVLFDPATGELIASTYGRGAFVTNVPVDLDSPPEPPPPELHPRDVSLRLVRHLRVRGQLGVQGSAPGCVDTALLQIQRKTSRGWEHVTALETQPDGSFRSRIADRPGRYRAVASETIVGTRQCGAATSPVARHRH